MPRIYFWNTEHLSPNAARNAEAAAASLEREERGKLNREGRSKDRPSMRVTRGMRSHAPSRAARSSTGPTSKIVKAPTYDRETRKSIASYNRLEDARQDATILRNKVRVARGLVGPGRHVFFCEVMKDLDGARSSLGGGLPGAAPGDNTLCYAYFKLGPGVDFTMSPTDDHHFTVPGMGERVPKGVTIPAIGGDMLFFFWHAPSLNNGQVVAEMYNALFARYPGQDFILFGDLNCDPVALTTRWHIPPACVLTPVGGTRISGKKLDFALSNAKTRFAPLRALTASEGFDIKIDTGSDHMAMCLTLR